MIYQFPRKSSTGRLTKQLARWTATDPVISALISEIAEAEERPKSYVGRQLLLRGLIQYRHDGCLGPKAATMIKSVSMVICLLLDN
jgi:hypothetical protein